MTFFRCFFVALLRPAKSHSETDSGAKNDHKDLQDPPKRDPRAPPKTHFPAFLEFLIFDAPLSYNCCLRRSRCSKFSSGRSEKTTWGRASDKTGPGASLSALFPEIVSKWLSQGVPGRVREPPFSNFFRSWLPWGLPGGPWIAQMLPKGASGAVPPVTRVPRGPIFIDFESMWARFCDVFWIDSWSRRTYLPTKKRQHFPQAPGMATHGFEAEGPAPGAHIPKTTH